MCLIGECAPAPPQTAPFLNRRKRRLCIFFPVLFRGGAVALAHWSCWGWMVACMLAAGGTWDPVMGLGLGAIRHRSPCSAVAQPDPTSTWTGDARRPRLFTPLAMRFPEFPALSFRFEQTREGAQQQQRKHVKPAWPGGSCLCLFCCGHGPDGVCKRSASGSACDFFSEARRWASGAGPH